MAGTLAKCAALRRRPGSRLFSKDAANKTGNSYSTTVSTRISCNSTSRNIVKLDPLTIGHFFAEIGEPVATADIIPYEEFLETRAYREWVQPQGWWIS